MIKEISKKLLLVFGVLILQFFLLPKLSLGQFFDLPLILFFFWIFSGNYRFLYPSVLICGLLFDLFSAFPLGSKTIVYLIFCLAMILIRRHFLRSLSPTVLMFSIVAGVVAFLLLKEVTFLILAINSGLSLTIFVQIFANSLVAILAIMFFKRRLFDS
jgi:hypothetical protein